MIIDAAGGGAGATFISRARQYVSLLKIHPSVRPSAAHPDSVPASSPRSGRRQRPVPLPVPVPVPLPVEPGAPRPAPAGSAEDGGVGAASPGLPAGLGGDAEVWGLAPAVPAEAGAVPRAGRAPPPPGRSDRRGRMSWRQRREPAGRPSRNCRAGQGEGKEHLCDGQLGRPRRFESPLVCPRPARPCGPCSHS